ncbi:secreted RxLR effector protein 161-like [Ischnura elegans]|uniref:secreted RxLR effector protein 161-like n=1 Tax=Ischnura elegans TaxID=197161 RepID=UPI001ED8A2C8|nr:secreted RxLR effector protein 161-like [Ischnura elegans]
MEDAKGVYIPMDPEYPKLKGENDALPNNGKYREAVGALLYISTTTRPDISGAMSILCRRVSNPRQRDWEALKKLMRYLKQTSDMALNIYACEDLKLTGYVDADWGGDIQDRKSTSAYIFKLGNSAISCSSRKQSSVALSTTEAEYVSAASASQEGVWLRQLLHDLGEVQNEPIIIYEDNQGCIKIASNEKFSARTKHIDVRHHFIRDLMKNNVIQLVYCRSEDMIADALTKPLPKIKFEELRNGMGLTT